MAAISTSTEPAIFTIATRHILSFTVASLVYCLQLASAGEGSAGVPDMAAYTGKAFIASFSSHPVYGNRSLNVQLSSSSSSTFNRLRSWFTFNATTRSISGVPLPEDVGWTLLTIKTECDQVKNLEEKDAYLCRESSDEFKLTVHLLSWTDFLAPRMRSTEPSLVSSVGLPGAGSTGSAESTSGDHGCGEDRVIASLVLCVSIEDLNTKDRFDLMVKLSDFLSIPISAIILESSSSHTLKAMENGFQMVSAGPGSGEICSQLQNVELVWELPCSTVKHLADFLRVLQHNVDGGRLANEIHTGIVGWYVASSNSLLTKHNRRRRRAGHHTVFPTPVLRPVRPTTVAASDDDDVIVSSSAFSPPIVHGSSSIQLARDRHEDSLYQASSSLLSLTSIVTSSSSVLPLLSVSSTTYGISGSRSVLHPSPSVLDTLSEIQSTVMQEPISATSHSTPGTSHLLDTSFSAPSITAQLIEMPDQSIDLSTSIIVAESPLPVITTIARTEATSVIASASSHLLDEMLTSISQEPIVDGAGSSVSTSTVLSSESGQLLSSDVLFSSSQLPSLSLLLFDSAVLVTSRTVEIAFPFISVDTESSISGIPSAGIEFTSSADPSLGTELSTLAEVYVNIESSVVAKSSPELSIDFMFSHSVSDEIVASLQQYVYEYSTACEHVTTSQFQGGRADEQSSLLITQSLSELVAATLSQTSDTVDVEIDMTVSPPYALSQEVTPILDTITGSDIYLTSDQILTASVADRDISYTYAVDDDYTSVISHIYSVEIVVPSIEPTFNITSSTVPPIDTVEVSLLAPSVTVIMPSAIVSPPESGVISKLTASLTPTITTSFTSAMTEIMESQQSASLSPDTVDMAVVQETMAWLPSTPTQEVATDDGKDKANSRPYVNNPIIQILGEQGRLLRHTVPHDAFVDKEDGNTSSLTLSLMSEFNEELTGNFWLYLETGEEMTLTGLPLLQDMEMKNFTVLLVAKDKEGLTATNSITVQIADAPRRSFTHVFIMKFALNYQQYMHDRRNLPILLNKIREYFNDNETHFITVLDVNQGSLVLSWTNNTLTGNVCQMDMIKNLLGKMVLRDGTVRASFYRQVGQETNLTEILFEPRGSCYVPPTTTIATTTTYLVSDTSRARGLSVWAHVILPVMIAVLVFVLIILIIVFCNRRRRHRQAVLNVEKEAVSNDRNPIFFQDELEVDDPSLKARDPLVLPTDPHPNNQSTPQDLSASKNSRDQERTLSQDHTAQEWVTKENTEAEQDHERHSDQKHRKGSKKQKEQSKDGGVSASSTLTWDRPNNHYLEEEAGSRSSTLNSTKSLGSEKRHPKNPPPYWQSQSDPPPYRLPPPYLTETTSQV